MKFSGLFLRDVHPSDSYSDSSSVFSTTDLKFNPHYSESTFEDHNEDLFSQSLEECTDPLNTSLPGIIIQRYVCFKCNKVYRNKCTLNRHLRYECGPGKHFKCPFCPLRSKRKDYVDMHILRKHDLNGIVLQNKELLLKLAQKELTKSPPQE